MIDGSSFSVVVPTWNRVRTLPRALSSILAQSLQPLEVIVVDDGSSDGTADMLAARFATVRVIRHARNRGSAEARNTGIRAARGSHVAWLDSDDAWLPDYLARVAEAWSTSSDAVFVHTDYVKVAEEDPDNRRPVTVQVPEDQIGAMLHNNFVHTCSVFSATASLLRATGGFDPAFKVSHDRALFLRLLIEGKGVHLPEPLVLRHVGEDNLINDMASWWRDCIQLIGDSLARPELRRYGSEESAMRLELWNVIQWHHRDLERRLARRQHDAAPADGASGASSMRTYVLPATAEEFLTLSLPGRPSADFSWPRGLSGFVLFLHSAGVPAVALARRSAEVTGLPLPESQFSLDSPMLEVMRRRGSGDLARHFLGLAEEAVATGASLVTAKLDAAELRRLDGEALLDRLFDLPVRVLRWRWQDRALQAVLASGVAASRGRPSFRLMARALVKIEESEAYIEHWCRCRSIDAPVLTVEALSESTTAPLAEHLSHLALEPKAGAGGPLRAPHPRARAAARWFRAEAARRYWSHALD